MQGAFFGSPLPHICCMSVQESADALRDEFAFLDDWEARYSHIIDMGRANPPLAGEERTDITRVRGCASQVWLVSEATRDGRLHFRAESDAILVSGLIAILIRLFSDQRVEDIADFDAHIFFRDIGVADTLTAQRSNGLASMLARIQSEAQELAARRSDGSV